MHMLAKVAGGEVDEYYDVLQAFFAEGADGSGLVMTFQRQLSVEPWNGDPSTDDYFNNSYCMTLGSEVTIYGGLEQVSFLDSRGCFYFSDHAATELGIGRQLIVDFKVSEHLLQLFQRFLRQAVTWGVPSQIPQTNGLAFESSIMDAPTTQPKPDEGIKAPNLRGGHLKLRFMSQEQLDREDGNPPDNVAGSSEPSPEESAYLSNLTPFQQKICGCLHDLGWIDTDICKFLIQFENGREHVRAELRMKGQSETDIQKLEDVCETDMEDFSHLRRSGGNRALEQYRSELYLLHENKRQRRVMLNEE
ncbi:uncharacterized protein PGRI_040380 [Penicillium griseofulvum]|uniref:Uncharacterized protein n=1 Tax=Penicillium patulum TaxID=5078 RepID=A0A135L948_PENPA|nr:uncharacterized protein PGRI_040380 [Penicillium griseofulvum]KXG45489.1 hypothetical protein PGRI_040380 [Penicillium griseofulvum]